MEIVDYIIIDALVQNIEKKREKEDNTLDLKLI